MWLWLSTPGFSPSTKQKVFIGAHSLFCLISLSEEVSLTAFRERDNNHSSCFRLKRCIERGTVVKSSPVEAYLRAPGKWGFHFGFHLCGCTISLDALHIREVQRSMVAIGRLLAKVYIRQGLCLPKDSRQVPKRWNQIFILCCLVSHQTPSCVSCLLSGSLSHKFKEWDSLIRKIECKRVGFIQVRRK